MQRAVALLQAMFRCLGASRDLSLENEIHGYCSNRQKGDRGVVKSGRIRRSLRTYVFAQVIRALPACFRNRTVVLLTYKRHAVGVFEVPLSNKIDNTRKIWLGGPPPGAQDAADNNLVVNIS